MKLRPGPYRDVADYTEIIQMKEVKFRDDLMILKALLKRPGVLLLIFSLVILATVWNYVGNANEALAAENAWRHLENETPSPDRNLWVYWESGECARWARYDPKELGFHTTTEILAEIEWWLYSFDDEQPPVRYCTYE